MNIKGKWILLLLLALLPTACRKEVEMRKFDFTATIEQPTGGDSKVLLLNEEWIYWEIGDRISVGSDQTDAEHPYTEGGTLINAGSGDFEDFVGAFITYLPWESKYFVGLHPYSENNQIIGTPGHSTPFTVNIDFPAEQPIRGDSTFGKQVMPMVAWYGGEWASEPYTPFNFDFHSLGAIVRLQLFNSTTTKTIDRIEITPQTGYKYQLSGMFNVQNYNTFDPHLQATKADPSDAEKTITITCGDGLEMAQHTLWSFYLVVPAYKGMDDSSYLHLTMTVKTKDAQQFSKKFTVPTRRNGITYMNAINITDWTAGASNTPGLVGNGTKQRPFKIYTLADLTYLRSCYNSADNPRRINGQPITQNTEIRIMRSDIKLEESTWISGINDFVGHMTYYGSNSSYPGITNNSQFPLFQSIASGGNVEGLTVKVGDVHNFTSAVAGYSPFCIENNGTIKNCRLVSDTSNGTLSVTSHFAGICVQNNSTGIIQGCGCLATVSKNAYNSYHMAGICLVNTGTIDGCYAASPLSVSNFEEAAGICYTNSGTVQNSYFSAQVVESDASWGGIVFNQTAGTITNCYTGELANIYSTGTVGGIVNTLSGGMVDHCRGEMNLRGSIVGGIAATQADGTIRNCYCDNPLMTITVTAGSGHYGGGLVGRMVKGHLENSFCNMGSVNRLDNQSKTGGIVGQIEGIGSGDGANTKIRNIYLNLNLSNSKNFYGHSVNDMQFSQCYVIDGGTMQYGINAIASPLEDTPVSSDIANGDDGTIGQMRTLLNSFVETSSYPDGWWKWARTNDTPGSLSGGTGLPYLILY